MANLPVKALGLGETNYPKNYSPEILEAFPNLNPDVDAWASFICTEFSSLCPKTGQPDFAKIFINYIADKKMIESKSLKLYLFSFRNHGDFHEDCVTKIAKDLTALISPKYLEVVGEFTPRGGIAIFPYVNYACSDKKYQDIKTKRQTDYAPGKYSLPLSKIY
ncbi:MAG: 7-cyano-7-deazaguanine reductase [Bdellovibrionales bacterium RIFOXYD12_FULL_39_22]|nr:MAG: 7-cyano-7-deazaguanine reductase [Bdellovibrionales bacterium RIFOXYB1_FULL_39_21]OFZ41768.1 MAG: 7-cyano-7-deazaguanine reductase [Bdellovibrionales bacterium RIFOXYC12_FULL_39_17]OFZ46168.1 MAG: 7-cyano-7-deazaguanine reductase [Bdellovibrionales bacterium RIFOXYC1_FULL_39_130]OFZ74994.1 MAG: 7-cyano-7-deazaguanine reductase [Bdellovibrionales bacterium RIFOXYD1_FULL_39_84]OFZ75157.1 MAG: 7-cyano-7-deazaguanine reductase [Bdellovibrionales bacterium RIFOXYC2_FULL_39_8]OFZ92847.1 MAG: